MDAPDAFTTRPMPADADECAAGRSTEFLLLALRAGREAREGWLRLSTRLTPPERPGADTTLRPVDPGRNG